MSQQDNFAGGFFLGAIVGGAVGGVLGALLASRRLSELPEDEANAKSNLSDVKAEKGKKRLSPANSQSIEAARRSLEDKIAQLNEAIDDVRQRLSNVNGNASDADNEQSLTKEP